MNIFKKHFLNNSELSKKDYTRDRAIFIIDASVEEFVGNILGGSYLASLLAFFCINEAKSTFILSLSRRAGTDFRAKDFSKFHAQKTSYIHMPLFQPHADGFSIFIFAVFKRHAKHSIYNQRCVFYISLPCISSQSPLQHAFYEHHFIRRRSREILR